MLLLLACANGLPEASGWVPTGFHKMCRLLSRFRFAPCYNGERAKLADLDKKNFKCRHGDMLIEI